MMKWAETPTCNGRAGGTGGDKTGNLATRSEAPLTGDETGWTALLATLPEDCSRSQAM